MKKAKVIPPSVVVMTSTGLMPDGTVLLPMVYGSGVPGGKVGNMVTGLPLVRTLNVPVLAPGPPPIAAGLIKVMLDDVNESEPVTEIVPVIGVA